MSQATHLRAYRFESTAFDGGVLSAIERMDLLGDTELLDALLVLRDAASGELQAIDLGAAAGEDRLSALLDFRLDPRRRGALTEKTLAEHPGGVPQPLIEAIAATLEAGAGFFAALYAGADPVALEDALARSGGRLVADAAVDARGLADAAERLRDAAAP